VQSLRVGRVRPRGTHIIKDQHPHPPVFQQILGNKVKCVEPVPIPAQGPDHGRTARRLGQRRLHLGRINPPPHDGGTHEGDVNVVGFVKNLIL